MKADNAPPAMVAQPANEGHAFAGWQSLRGQVVVVDFWTTWCTPCLPELEKIAALAKTFSGRPVQFVTVALDDPVRVKQYLAEKRISLQTFVDDAERTQARAWGVRSIPATAVVDAQGKVVGLTAGENVTADVVRKLLAGEDVNLPQQARESDLMWDRNDVQWLDGVEPLYQVVIKPIETSSGGYTYVPGANRISGDGTPVVGMIVAAWQTDGAQACGELMILTWNIDLTGMQCCATD